MQNTLEGYLAQKKVVDEMKVQLEALEKAFKANMNKQTAKTLSDHRVATMRAESDLDSHPYARFELQKRLANVVGRYAFGLDLTD